MAKGPAGKSGGMARIRFVMVDAEIPDGQMGSVTQAIQNALRGPSPVAVQRLSGSASNGTAHDANGADTVEVEQDFEEQEVVANAGAEPARQRAPRTPAKTPDILTDVDLTSDMSLVGFAAQHPAESHRQRYLVIAAWFNKYRETKVITAAHIYTGYRHLKWPTNIPDFAQPLRDLKFRKLFGQPVKGSYEINHIGLQEVDDLAKS
jgi:hypothetical protein